MISCFVHLTPCNRVPVFQPKVRIGAVFVATVAATSIFSNFPPRTENIVKLGIIWDAAQPFLKAQTNDIGSWLVFDSCCAQLRRLSRWHCCLRSDRWQFCTIDASWWWWTVRSTFYGKLRKLRTCKHMSEGETCFTTVLTQLSTKTFLSTDSPRNNMTILLLVIIRQYSGKRLA